MMERNVSATSMPNLPGTRPDKTTWVFRESEGFKRMKARPLTANASVSRPSTSKLDTSSWNLQNHATSNDILMDPSKSMPNFTGFGGSNYNNASSSAVDDSSRMRPKTAGPETTYRGPTPLHLQSTFQYPLTKYDQGFQARPNSSSIVPHYIAYDKKVLRFYAHFFMSRNWDKDSPLGEPIIEADMIRLVTIMYHLMDDQVEINEPKAENTGTSSGSFYRKSELIKTNGQPLGLMDLLPRSRVHMLGQEFIITDADGFTREYYKNALGVSLPPPLPRPKVIRKDIGAQYATGMGPALPQLLMMTKDHYGTRSTDYLTLKEGLEKTKMFLENDGKILRFECCEVLSKHPPFFPELQMKAVSMGYYNLVASADVKTFAIAFYLSTGYLELTIQKLRSSSPSPDGKNKNKKETENSSDEPKLILKKGKVPVNWKEAQRGLPPKYYGPNDLNCGTVIDIYGRYFLLLNCDPFTKDFYEKLGRQMNEVMLLHEDRPAVTHEIPKRGDGFLPIGSNEDSLGTVFGMPKPKKDLKKLQRNHGRMIRCKTVLLSDDEIDSSREFLLTFYLEDDTIAMYEDVGRNSGIWGGNYLKRGRYLNTLPHGYEGLNDPYKDNTPRYIIAQDIYFGNILAFNGKEFQIIEMDSMSLQYCENSPQDFPFMDTFQIIGNLLNVVTNRKLDLRPAFRSRDVTKVGYFDFNTFIEALDALQLTKGLNDQQTLTLMRRFKDDDDKFIYDELCDILSHVYTKQHAAMSGSSSTFIGEAAYGSRQVRKKIALNVSSFKHFLEASRVRTIPWRRAFRIEPNTTKGFTTLATLLELFHKNGIELSSSISQDIKTQYIDKSSYGQAILKELQSKNATDGVYQGLDLKIKLSSKKSHKLDVITTDEAREMTKKNGSSQKLKGNRSMYGSLLRRSIKKASSLHGEKQDGDESGTTEALMMMDANKPSNILINYNRLCDDIYIAEWL